MPNLIRPSRRRFIFFIASQFSTRCHVNYTTNEPRYMIWWAMTPKVFFFFLFGGDSHLSCRLNDFLCEPAVCQWRGLILALAEIPFHLGHGWFSYLLIFFFVPELFRGFLRLKNVRQWKIVEVKKVDSVGWGVKDRFIWLHTIWCDVQVEELYLNPSFSGAGSLQITNSEEEDQGKYECVAENSLGIEISNVSTLHVRGESLC